MFEFTQQGLNLVLVVMILYIVKNRSSNVIYKELNVLYILLLYFCR